MSASIDVRVPDIGDFKDVPIIEVHVGSGDTVAAEDALITLESDKASMDVPAPQAGTVREVKVRVGDTVSEGDLILTLSQAGTTDPKPAAGKQPESTVSATAPAAAKAPGAQPVRDQASDLHAETLVLGAGPGGYTAAFRAADLGRKVVLVDPRPSLGGVCLNVGCIPSKALLHAARVVSETQEMAAHGLSFGPPGIDYDKLRGWKDSVVKKLTSGLAGMAKQRKVTVVQGYGRFVSPTQVEVTEVGADWARTGTKLVSFDTAIIATGSEPVRLPFIPHDDPRVMDSTSALELQDFPERLLVLGGGIIGLEMATVYHALGAKVSVVELMEQLIPVADADIVKPLHKRIKGQYEAIHLGTKVTAVEARPDGLAVHFDGPKAPESDRFDKILVAVGRTPNGRAVAAEAAGVIVDEKGFIRADRQQRTNVPHIFAIGDVIGQPMLAHKATHEGKVAAEVAAGLKSAFDAKTIPSVAYTDPEVAWVGMTEQNAKARGHKVDKAVFPWAASGRALSINRTEGMTKLLFDPDSEQVVGAGLVGPNAGELIAEVALAIEMGADARDIGLTIHPHPTLSESVGMSAEVFEGTITDLYMPKKKK